MSPVAELVAQARAAGVIISRGNDGHLQMRGPRRAADLAQTLRSRESEVLALLPPAHRCLCGTTTGVRLYISGYRCAAHTPAALAGRPEPGEHNSAPYSSHATPPQATDALAWPSDETGYCTTCRQLCHRYGEHGNPLCGDCKAASTTT